MRVGRWTVPAPWDVLLTGLGALACFALCGVFLWLI